jgi:hypothetical protein
MVRSALVLPTSTWFAITKGRARHDFRAGQLDVARPPCRSDFPCDCSWAFYDEPSVPNFLPAEDRTRVR